MKVMKYLKWILPVLLIVSIFSLVLVQIVRASDDSGNIADRWPMQVRQAHGAIYGLIKSTTGADAANQVMYVYTDIPVWAKLSAIAIRELNRSR